MERSNKLSEITVDVSDLIEVVVENRDKHLDELGLALDRFYESARNALFDRIAEVTNETIKDLRFDLPVPESHAGDYDRVVKMLEMTLNAGQDTVVLRESEQESYVMDNWDWKRAFTETTAFYAKGRM